MSYVNVNLLLQLSIIFHWVGFISFRCVSYSLHCCLFVNEIILFHVVCTIVLKCCANILLRIKHHLLPTLSSLLRLPADQPSSLSSLLLSNPFLHFIFSCSSRPPWSQVPFPSNIHLFFLLPSSIRCLPAFRFSNPLSPTLQLLLLSSPW